MELENLLKEITENYFLEDYYRFDLNLPKKIIGRGRKHEMYVAPFECKPWVNGDCKIPIKYLEGAMIKEIIKDRIIISFLIGLNDLLLFISALSKEVDIENDVELVEIDSRTLDNET